MFFLFFIGNFDIFYCSNYYFLFFYYCRFYLFCITISSKLHQPPSRLVSVFQCHYKLTLDELLCKLDMPDDVLSCSNLFCELHFSFISSLHEHIVSSLVTAAQESNTFTQPYSKPNRTHPGWNEFC